MRLLRPYTVQGVGFLWCLANAELVGVQSLFLQTQSDKNLVLELPYDVLNAL